MCPQHRSQISGTRLAGRAGAHSNHDIRPRRQLIPRLADISIGPDPFARQQCQRTRMNIPGRLAAGTHRLPAGRGQMVEDCLAQDRAAGITGAEQFVRLSPFCHMQKRVRGRVLGWFKSAETVRLTSHRTGWRARDFLAGGVTVTGRVRLLLCGAVQDGARQQAFRKGSVSGKHARGGQRAGYRRACRSVKVEQQGTRCRMPLFVCGRAIVLAFW